MRIAIYFAVGCLLGSACLIVQGPLPGDVQVTRALQSIFGSGPFWAQLLTNSAKLPVLWVTLFVATLLAFARGGWRSAMVPAPALILAEIFDTLLRQLVFAPRPTANLVAVLAPTASSGLPSTFGLVYGALFGVVIFMSPNRNIVSVTAFTLALFLIVAGASGRVVLGGHWASQIIASTFIGLALASTIHTVLSWLPIFKLETSKTKR